MSIELNQYLTKTESYLKDISPTERAAIVLEIQSQIKSSINMYPDKTINQILQDIGSPASVANRYRSNKGLKTFKENKPFSFFKFIFTISVIFFLIIVAGISILAWKFTPVFKLDEQSNRITILGGLIDINGKSGKVKIMDNYQFVDNNFTNSFEGSIDIMEENYDEVVVNFKSGTLNLSYTEQDQVSWDCKLDSPPKENFINKSEEIIELDFEELDGISCDVTAPTNYKTTVDAQDGRVRILEPFNDVYIEIDNGDIIFRPKPEFD